MKLSQLWCNEETKYKLKAEAAKRGMKLKDYLDELAKEKIGDKEIKMHKKNGFHMRL